MNKDISSFDIFKIGIGPSSSHTVGPMKAGFDFIQRLHADDKLKDTKIIKCDLYGSLALTGKGHGTDKAVILGLLGHTPETIDSSKTSEYIQKVKESQTVVTTCFDKVFHFYFSPQKDLKFHRKMTLPYHSNALSFAAFDDDHQELFRLTYYSIGGGFILNEHQINDTSTLSNKKSSPFSFDTAKQMLELCSKHEVSISELMMKHELTWKDEKQIHEGLYRFYDIMNNCIQRGLVTKGILPGGLKVKRRAPEVYKNLQQNAVKNLSDSLSIMDWVNLYALAVNEENAAGGQVVTAPTNGAAGIIPAVLKYYLDFYPKSNKQGILKFLLTASAIAILYKKNASISGAEVGCQGEVGVACSMAAGALTEVMGGTPTQVENAAEIAMEHNLGLTCDPIGGLVQIPCIERNAMGAIKAINASRMALQGDGSHFVSLDKVIKTMMNTGKDMQDKYKETSRGGLAVNIPEC